MSVHQNGTLINSLTGADDVLVVPQGRTFTVGAAPNEENRFDGKLKEILLFNTALTSAEVAQIHNYLSAKWDNALGDGLDYYAGDTLANGDYDTDVNGILKLADSKVSAAKRGGLIINNIDFLKDSGDAVFAGHNNAFGSSTANLPSGSANMRSQTIWYLDASDEATGGGQISLNFELDHFGLEMTGASSDYFLLWRAGQTGQFHQIAMADRVEGNMVGFDDISVNTQASNALIQSSTDLINDGYFTVGVNDYLAPEYASVEASGNIITLSFDEYLNTAVAPSGEAFSVSVGSTDRVVSDVVIDGVSVLLTIEGNAIGAAEVVRVSYQAPQSGVVLEDVQGNDAQSILPLFIGSASNDTIIGTTFDDVIIGHSGADVLSGNAGQDVFQYQSVNDGNDVISDFVIGSGSDADQLDLKELLSFETGDSLANFISVTDDGTDVSLAIDANGDGSGTDLAITLLGIGTGAVSLADIEVNNLVVI